MTREHHGMKFVPDGTFRRPGSSDHPPTWWEIFYRDPELGGRAVLLGKSERQRRHQEFRFFSIYGDYQTIVGWVKGVEWLLECHASAKARNDSIRFVEAEKVREEPKPPTLMQQLRRESGQRGNETRLAREAAAAGPEALGLMGDS